MLTRLKYRATGTPNPSQTEKQIEWELRSKVEERVQFLVHMQIYVRITRQLCIRIRESF